MKDILRKYWWAFAIITLVPVTLNFTLQIPVFVKIVGDNTIWLMFWGNYLGAIISAWTALFILCRTLQQNHEENEKNRIANEQANEKNRRLQIKVLEYQQQMQWLNLFRQASAQYIQIYNTNDLIAISNVLVLNLNDAHNMLKTLFDRAIKYDTQFAYLRKADDNTKELMKKTSPKFENYNDVLLDIQHIITFKKRFPGALFAHLATQMSTMELSQAMKNKITHIVPLQYSDTMQPFVELIMARIGDIKNDMVEIRDLLYDYIHSEQSRIDKILEE